MRRELPPLILVLLLALFPSSLYGQTEIYSIEATDVTVFRDGVVLVRQRLLANATFPSITVPLLAAYEQIGNLLALDQRGIPLNYDPLGSNLTIHTLGASQASLQYETQNLTSKRGSVWTIIFDAPYSLNVTLPEQSTIIFLSEIPSEISVNGTSPRLLLQPGKWEISYVLPLTDITTTTTVTTQPPILPPIAFQYALGASAIAGAGLFAYVLIRSGRFRMTTKGPVTLEELRPEERDVMQFITEKGGRVLESELRVKFLLPKTSMWRLVRRLERRGFVRVRKVGLQNEIELVK